MRFSILLHMKILYGFCGLLSCSTLVVIDRLNITRIYFNIFLSLTFPVLCSVPVFAWEARVVAVSDGDTITVEPLSGGERSKVRLHGIDAPERKQPYGEVARAFVFDTSLYKIVDIEELYQDRYKRSVSIVNFPNGISLQYLMLDSGLAWVWPRYCKNCPEWEALQERAMNNRCGLWSDENPVPPWEWRKRKR